MSNTVLIARLRTLIGEYWDIGYAEGKNGMANAEAANAKWHDIDAALQVMEREKMNITKEQADKVIDGIEFLHEVTNRLLAQTPGQQLTLVGFENATDGTEALSIMRGLEDADWSRFHHLMKKYGLHPGRTDDDLIEILDAHLASMATSPQAAQTALESKPL